MCDVPDEQHQGSERYLAARELDLHQLVDSRHESDGSKADRSLFDHLAVRAMDTLEKVAFRFDLSIAKLGVVQISHCQRQ